MATIKSIKEKAKAYDKAIEKIQKYVKDDYGCTRLRPEDIFPELKESEDEKILRHLKAVVKEYDMWAERGLDMNDVLAWLGKRGEQNPKFRVGDTIKCKHDDRQFTIKSVDLDKGTYTYTQEGCGNDIDYADEEFELVEQNPAWSEEDEKKANNLYVLLDQMVSFNMLSDKDATEFKDWLKSLKERVLHQNTWKPSDEQMAALKFVIESLDNMFTAIGYMDNYTKPHLEEILEALKKLREE